MDFASAILRNISPNSTYGLTLSPPAALANDYTITLPTLPGSNLPLSINSSGTMSAALVTGSQIANTTIAAANIVANTITSSQIANATITTTQISASAGILGTQIAAATIAGSNIASTTIAAGNIVNNTVTQTQVATSFITSGTYSPSAVASTNVAGGWSVSTSTYHRVGSMVTVCGTITMDASGGVGTVASVSFQIPINSTFSGGVAGGELGGMASGRSYQGNFVMYAASANTVIAYCAVVPATVIGSDYYPFSFSYRID
jgi:hypothetical protein